MRDTLYVWVVIAGAALVYFCAGCVDIQPCASYLDEHLEQAVAMTEEIARATPEDSPAVPFVKELDWRLKTRMRPWTSELRRYAGPTVVEIAKDMKDNRALLVENRAMEDFSAQIDFNETLPFKPGSPFMGLDAIASNIGGSGIVGMVAMLVVRNLKRKLATKDKTNRKCIEALNQVKTVNKDAVVAATEQDPDLKLAYEQYKAELVQDEMDRRALIRKRL